MYVSRSTILCERFRCPLNCGLDESSDAYRYVLLTGFEVCIISYRRIFFPLIYDQRAFAGHYDKLMGEKMLICNGPMARKSTLAINQREKFSSVTYNTDLEPG